MADENRTAGSYVQAGHARWIDQQKARDFKFILDVCCWFDLAFVFTVLQLAFFVAFALMPPPEGHALEDWLSLVRGLRTTAVLSYELPFIFRKTRWISICRRHRLPSNMSDFGSTMSLVEQLILIGTIEPQVIQLWHAHQLEEPLLGQSTGVLLTAFVVATAIFAVRKMVVRFVFLVDLAVYLKWKQQQPTLANPRDTASWHD
ncbi:hypothetical protein LX32DRAFT_314989 [Colletotrichum zoysiae]|uniref:Uncharacterized protein n=1 Tax=Colletotrichum zoysiae TaxID=1216348 RepID=A0AAD9M6H9_9PEZI|nr:hypothetical protein LX32DRAFT_314989 [Colletotrichum zoysiae]